jgi:hypothetical protein
MTGENYTLTSLPPCILTSSASAGLCLSACGESESCRRLAAGAYRGSDRRLFLSPLGLGLRETLRETERSRLDEVLRLSRRSSLEDRAFISISVFVPLTLRSD